MKSKIDCTTPSEQITDVLGAASEVMKRSTADLSIRDMGRGRGCVVMGLTEVAISAAADIDSIIKHVIINKDRWCFFPFYLA